ncbi:MAG: YhbY family RNA-binding protein [Betaproteobacteria bacterium]|nr:MAG: YhbY family RNA-binding protein [Betaproteobacteria bacterium]
MNNVTAEQRRALRAKAHHLRPVVAVGMHGLTPAVLHEIDSALKAHELIKIRVFSDVRSERDALLARICGELECAPVQHLGKLLIVWRHNPDLHRAAGDDNKPRRARGVRRLPVKSPESRDEKSSRSRIAPPTGTPRAPSRRRRNGTDSAVDHRGSDQSRRRRRAH